jgi:lysozyme
VNNVSFLEKWFNNWENRELEELKLDEGLRLKAYKDTEGIWTNGYGHAYVEPDSTCTIAQAGDWLDEDWDVAYARARKICDAFDGLDGPRKGVMVNMAFNLGNRLSQFKNFLAAVNAGEYKIAAEEMMDSKWAKQVGKRANRLAYRMSTGSYSLRT